MKIAIASDHGGYELRKLVASYLQDNGHEVVDHGCYSHDSVDYPDFAKLVCDEVGSGSCEAGILICGTGIGMSIAANRHRNIRAALCHEAFTARMSREHNNANVLCLGERVIGSEVALDAVRVWVNTEFAGGRHQKRLDKLS
ncbi:MAG: ribose 5-phosphate isomerase B [Desulfobulbaceae bacterium]|nr:ribose 5-phosphate isomerase B [Desulfobulbaceae bacterium]